MGTLYREMLTLSLKLVQELGLVVTNAGTRTRSSQPHSPRAPLALRSWLVDYVFCRSCRVPTENLLSVKDRLDEGKFPRIFLLGTLCGLKNILLEDLATNEPFIRCAE
jgi:hypothetical protein